VWIDRGRACGDQDRIADAKSEYQDARKEYADHCEDHLLADCDECVRLWRNLASATAASIRLDNKLKIATLQRDHDVVAVLTPEAEEAFAARDQAREMIRLHDAAKHGAQ
jgi:hypothetical protein